MNDEINRHSKSKRILVVDDEVAITLFMKELLEISGYEVVAMNASQDALRYFEENNQKVDLVITDFTMPQMNGVKMAQSMMAIKPELPVILCSGYREHIDAAKAQQLMIREYIEKPLSTDKLLNAIEQHIN